MGGEAKPIKMTLTLTDRLIIYHYGVIKYVLVKVNDFVLPIDFIIIDMEVDAMIHLILGRTLLLNGRENIDLESGELVLKFIEEKIIFNVLNTCINMVKKSRMLPN